MSKVSYYLKEAIECPICNEKFKKEEMLTGSGRLIAGALKVDLKREYQTNEKYGKVYPRIYSVIVCPKCLYSTYSKDFRLIEKEQETIEKIKSTKEKREKALEIFDSKIDFTKKRDLISGAASYITAILSYEYFPTNLNPTFNQAKSALRLAWIFEDLEENFPNKNYNYLQKIFYYKAAYLYKKTLENNENDIEPIENISNFGPDTDKNYGFDSVLYLGGLLEYFYGERENINYRIKELSSIKTIISKIVGFGKGSKEKPSILIDKLRDVYYKISQELNNLKDNV